MINSRIFGLSSILFIFLFSVSSLHSQLRLEDWETHSSLLSTVQASSDSQGRIWVATSGGVFSYNRQTDALLQFRNIEALLSLDTKSITCNPDYQEIYIGSSDGYLEILTENLEWTHITDIHDYGYSNPSINDILVHDSLLYIAGGFGVSVFDFKKRIFLETVERLGEFPKNTQVNELKIFGDSLYAATEEGIASCALLDYKKPPNVWKNLDKSSGLNSKNVRSIEFHNDQLYAATDSVINRYEDGVFSKVIDYADWDQISNLQSIGGELYFSSLFSIQKINQERVYQISKGSLRNQFIYFDSDNSLIFVALLQDDGIEVVKHGADTTFVIPEAPYSNYFGDMEFSAEGNLWCATTVGGRGFMMLRDGKWKNFNMSATPEINSNSYWKISTTEDGRAIASSWGSGFCIITPNEDYSDFQYQVYDRSNSPLQGIASDADYVLVGETSMDRYGTIWITNYDDNPGSGPQLLALTTEGDFYSYNNPFSSTRGFALLALDPYSDYKWLGSFEKNLGLGYFDNEGQSSGGDWGRVYGDSDLDNDQTCFAFDKDGVLVIGTNDGLSYLYNPFSVANGSPANIFKEKTLDGVAINDLFIDAQNNRWIATNDGVYVYYANGEDAPEKISTDDYPIASDKVLSLAYDASTGRVYFGTENGLSSALSLAVEPLPSFDIKCYPQPFLPQQDLEMVIEGLAPDSDVRILTTDGKLVRTMQTTSQKLIWDGKDERNNFVNTGIYMVVATSQSKDESSVAKIAVIKKN
jgi:hypothetical protein